MNVELTVVLLEGKYSDVSSLKGDHTIALMQTRCSATNGHDSYDWTVTDIADVPRIGDKITVTHKASAS